MHPVSGQQHQYDEVRDEQGAIKNVGVIEALKSFVEQVLAEIVRDALGSGSCGQFRG
jgi:hypothetical protein